jgi:hypothetical protein
VATTVVEESIDILCEMLSLMRSRLMRSEDYFDSEFLRGWSLFEFSYAIFFVDVVSLFIIGGWLAQCFRTACTLTLITFWKL